MGDDFTPQTSKNRQPRLNSRDVLLNRVHFGLKPEFESVCKKSSALPLKLSEVQEIDEILAVIDKLIKAKQKPEIIFIDYIQLVSSGKKDSIPENQIADVVQKLKAYINKHHLCVVALAQQNEKPYQKAPTVGNLRSSTSIGHYAETISFICHQEEKPDEAAKCWVEIIKNRNGGEPNAWEIALNYEHFRKTGIFLEGHSLPETTKNPTEERTDESRKNQETNRNNKTRSPENAIPGSGVPVAQLCRKNYEID